MNIRLIGTRVVVLLVILLLVACAELPKLEFRDLSSIINIRKSKAVALKEQGYLAEALLEWKILSLLRPDDNVILHELKAAKSIIDRKADAYMTAASEAANEGHIDAAYIYYLKALALDPNYDKALSQLRAIEAKYVRDVQQRNTKMLLESRKNARQRASMAKHAHESTHQVIPAKNENFESGVRFFEQADYVSSIIELNEYNSLYPNNSVVEKYLAEAHLKVARNYQQKGDLLGALSHLQKAKLYHENKKNELDSAIGQIKKQLADRYYEVGLRVYREDMTKAINYWRKSLSYNASHVRAKLYLQKGITMKKNLERIERTDQ